MLVEAQGVEEKDKWRVSVYDFINEAQGVEEKDKWRFSVYDFINEAQGAEEKDKWRFGRRGEGQVAVQRQYSATP
jgi:hypothetical protein